MVLTAAHHLALYLPALSIGGAERVMLNLAGAFAADGHRVDLVLDRRTGGFLSQVPAAVTLHDLAARRTVLAAPKLAQWLRRHRPAAMLSALPHNNLTAIWARALAGLPMRLVLSEHLDWSALAGAPMRWIDHAVPPLMRLSYRRADAVVGVSAGVAADVARRARLAPSAVTVIPNPIVTPGLLALAAEPLDHPWCIPSAPPVLLGVVRLTAQKDFA